MSWLSYGTQSFITLINKVSPFAKADNEDIVPYLNKIYSVLTLDEEDLVNNQENLSPKRRFENITDMISTIASKETSDTQFLNIGGFLHEVIARLQEVENNLSKIDFNDKDLLGYQKKFEKILQNNIVKPITLVANSPLRECNGFISD